MRRTGSKHKSHRLKWSVVAFGTLAFILSPWALSLSFAAGQEILVALEDHQPQSLTIQSQPIPDKELSTRGTGSPQKISPIIGRGVKLWDEASLGTNPVGGTQMSNMMGNVTVVVPH
jgi:hypothetical protein